MSETQICSKCHRELELNKFYKFKDNTQDTVCKECRLEGRRDWCASDYYPLFELYNIPYIYEEWDKLVNRQIKKCVTENKPYQSIFGKYLALMKLTGWKNWNYEDSEILNKKY